MSVVAFESADRRSTAVLGMHQGIVPDKTKSLRVEALCVFHLACLEGLEPPAPCSVGLCSPLEISVGEATRTRDTFHDRRTIFNA